MKKKKKDREQNYRSNTMYGLFLFSQVNIADAADLNPSGTNTSQVDPF